MADFKPTDEQIAALDMYHCGFSFAVDAGAGTGKTTVSTAIARSARTLGRRGQYTAFNAAIVKDAQKKMPDNCPASTMHSIAIRSLDPRLRDRLRAKRLSPNERARMCGLSQPMTITYGREAQRFSPSRLSGIVVAAINNFCKSDDREIQEWHFPYIDGIDEPERDAEGIARRGWHNNRLIRNRLLPHARMLWPKLINPESGLPFQHAYYLKMAQLDGIVIPVDFIIFDEAQDTSPVMADIIRQQDDHAQLIFVGDAQQAINGFTGAIDAMAKIPAEHRTPLTQSFRFGPAVADVANLILARLDGSLRLRGFERVPSVLTELETPSAVLTRTNATAVERVLREQEAGRKVHLVGGGTEIVSFATGALELKEKGWTSHPDLNCFTSWGQVQDYAAFDEEGSDLELNVKLVDQFGADVIIDALGARQPQARYADLIVSTAHKSKGLEFDSVQLAADFPSGKNKKGEDAPLDAEAWRLLYVAVTRAKLGLDVSSVAPVMQLMERAGMSHTRPEPEPEPVPALPAADKPQQLSLV